jgi:hypothetical protein
VVNIQHLTRDLDLMTPDPEGAFPPPVPPPFDNSLYTNLVYRQGEEEEEAAQVALRRSIPAWQAAYPTEQLQETSHQRASHDMALVQDDARWMLGNFVLLRSSPPSPLARNQVQDPFWVGRITREPVVVVDEETGADFTSLEVQWYVTTATRRCKNPMHAWLEAQCNEAGEPELQETDLESLYTNFTPRIDKNRPGLIKVPGREIAKLNQALGPEPVPDKADAEAEESDSAPEREPERDYVDSD